LEPFEFLLEVQKIKNLNEKEKIYFVAELINTYIETNAKKEINISGKSKKNLLKMYENQKKESEKWVLNISPENVLSEFIQTGLYLNNNYNLINNIKQ
jgi:hypothetical protein